MVDDHDGPVYTLDEALVAVGFGKFQSLVLIYAGLGSISEAMEVMILSFIGPSVKSEWNLSSTQESLITTVVFAGMLIGAYSWGLISDYFGRRMGLLSIALLSSVPAFATLLFYGLTLESPRYLCMNGQTSDAHNILEKVAAVNRKELPSGVLISGHKSEQDEEFAPLVDNELSLLAGKEVVVSKTGFSNLLMLFSSKLRRASLLLWVVFFGNAFLSYGLILLTSELSGGQSKCSSSPLHSYNSLNQDANLYTDVFVTSLAGLPGNILSAVIVDRIGRKPSMISMFMFGCIFLLPLVLHQHEIITTGLLFGARMLMVGTFTVANIYASEIYPTGVGVASAVGMISPVVAVQLVTGCHQAAAVLVFEVVLLLSSLSVLFLPFETMGRELADI